MSLVTRSLPFKVGALILVLFVGYAAAQFIVQQRILYPSFVLLEEAEARKNSERALKALERDLELLGPQVTDWATWDDSYEFVQDHNRAFVEENLTVQAMQNLRVNYLGFVDLDGQVVWQRALDLDSGKSLQPADLGLGIFTRKDPLLKAGVRNSKQGVLGIRSSALGPVLVAAQPVVKSNGEGPRRGVVIMGRILDAKGAARLAAQAQVDLKIEPLPLGFAGRAATALGNGVPYTPMPLIADSALTHSVMTVFDLAFKPAFQLRIDTPREITRQGQRTLRVAQITLATACMVVLLALLLTLNRAVFLPIAKLTRHAMKVGTSNDLEDRLELARDDEIGTLAREFNRMTERLAEARARLLEQSYKAGIAEMASGVLHNIGNAVTPLGIKLSGILTELRQAPQREIALANEELANAATASDRRDDLAQFMVLAATELGTLAGDVASRVSSALAHVEQIQLTLGDQQRFARAERVMETLKIPRILKECIALLPLEFQRKVTIELSPTLDLAPDVCTSRAALSQIVNNLLLNAMESIQEQRDHGHLRIATQVVDHHGTPALRTEFVDDGLGIATADLQRIFEAGMSTKNRGSGMGLHWSANTIAAMGGALWAESNGPGAGARLVMLLPLASAANLKLEAAA